MFPVEEWVTVVSGLAFTAVAVLLYSRTKQISALLWTIAAASFLVISIALAVMGLNALQLAVTPYLGSIYPGLLAAGIIASKSKAWRYYFAFVIVALVLMAAGSEGLVKISRVLLHSVSGLIIVFLPLVFAVKRLAPASSIFVSIGGLLISIGGLALATLMAGKPLLPFETVVFILHPLLFLSAFVMAAGLYVSRGLGLE
ncbi:hypothetical protein Asulf_01924 [Archaeoglobus sulfaticallidus PM70-1]|uniref:Uncharacterized protein n=1 Tax=Archaeoglobus sulfaticallidus PM70-1 TaxID=387631 RepID=N0BNJ4_9EURY|nr:hypothetical protein [Archaeoglobus sulfaticallidus]AGK61890.1 hypothetical protein Asulf_01924 [Archaeoglobus sulfaticallidus PM70-1]